MLFPVILLSQLNEHSKTTAEIETLLDSAHHHFTVLNLTRSVHFANEALRYSEEINYPQGIAYSKFYLGQSLFELGNYKEALHFLSLAEKEKHTQSNRFLQFEIHRVRGRVYHTMSLFDNSMKENKIALSIIPATNRTDIEKQYLTSLIYDNLTLNYRVKNQLDSSFYFLMKNKRLLENMDESFVFSNLMNNYSHFGIHYTNLEKFDSAQYYFSKSLKVAEKYNVSYRSYNYFNWGDMEMKKENFDKALEYYKKSLENLDELNYAHDLQSVYTKISLAYDKLGDADNANLYKLKALELKDKLKSEQLEASETALNEILNKKEIETAQKSNFKIILLVILSFSVLVLIISLIYLRKRSHHQSRKSKSLLKEKDNLIFEKEINELELKQKLNESFDEIILLAKSNSPEFWARFQEVYPEFRTKLLALNPELKPSEMILAAYTFLGFNTKDLAEYTFKAVQTIKNNKRNLRKRLGISTEENFSVWLRNYLE